MRVTIFAGKGGVGKSTIAAAFALRKSSEGKVLAVDYDGGHSLARVFSLNEISESNMATPTEINNLGIAIIDPIKFKSIVDFQKDGGDICGYLSQFEGDYGLIPFCDMVNAFFGVPTDPYAVSRFASLTSVYNQADLSDVDDLVIDVEPTAGLERLLGSMAATTRSIQNLKRTGIVKLTALGAFWPDIKAYLQGQFIQSADEYARRFVKTSDAVKNAGYFVVCVPESSPVDEMHHVESIIKSYGGKINGRIVNNIRGEPHEQAQIDRVRSLADKISTLEVQHDLRLCDSNTTSRRKSLKIVGDLF